MSTSCVPPSKTPSRSATLINRRSTRPRRLRRTLGRAGGVANRSPSRLKRLTAFAPGIHGLLHRSGAPAEGRSHGDAPAAEISFEGFASGAYHAHGPVHPAIPQRRSSFATPRSPALAAWVGSAYAWTPGEHRPGTPHPSYAPGGCSRSTEWTPGVPAFLRRDKANLGGEGGVRVLGPCADRCGVAAGPGGETVKPWARILGN